MALVKLRNLYGKEIKVSSSAVSSYRNLGFYPAEEFDENAIPVGSKGAEDEEDTVIGKTPSDDGSKIPENDSGKMPEKTDDEIFAETITKKPLASWNKNEIKRYAAIFNIDLTGTQSADEAKERIKAFMSDNE